MRIGTWVALAVLAAGLWAAAHSLPLHAQSSAEEAGVPDDATAQPASKTEKEKDCKPGFGCVTNLPLPRFVSLKGDEGNARRGPGLTHRIDWVFTRPGMPLKITAEFDNWRRVEDQDGAGGCLHHAKLDGTSGVFVTLDNPDLRTIPDTTTQVVAQAEMGVIGRVLECNPDWCRIQSAGEKGWVAKTALWGVVPGEIIE